MDFPWEYENSSICPMYKFLVASEEGDCIPALMESAGAMTEAVLHLAFYYCLPTSYTSLSQLEAASVMPNPRMFLLQIHFFF